MCYRDISNRGGRRECRGRRVSVVSAGDTEPLTEMVTFQQRLEREKGTGPEDIWGKSILIRGNNRIQRLNHTSCVQTTTTQQEAGVRGARAGVEMWVVR